jgi:23S rRNA pseudouridine2605 synthase
MPAERLQKIIAAAGIASRRKSEELIAAGRVLVNGQVVTELGTKADPEQDHIRVDGKLLQGPERYTYVVLNKPKGYVTTVSDEKKRPTVMDLVQKVKGRVYPVGRLDWASEGLLLMTNDGTLANALMKASSNVAKTYVVKVAGQPDEGKLDKLRRGVSIAEKGGRRVRTAPARIRLIREGDNPWLEVTIIEGRNRQVRKMFEEVGHHVEKIRRVQYGPLALDVPPGDWRNLTLLEVAKLKSAASGPKLVLPPSAPTPLYGPKAATSRPTRVRKSSSRSRSPRPSRSEKPTFVPRSSRPSQSEEPSFAKRSPRLVQTSKFSPKFSRAPRATTAKPSRASKRNRD